VIIEAKHAIAFAFEETRSPRVAPLLRALNVLSSIDLHDELG
jgi:hypothetical protein